MREESRVLIKNSPPKTEAARLVNNISNITGLSNVRYLEIGVERGFTFQDVDAKLKIGVDPKFKFNKRIKRSGIKLFEIESETYFSSHAKAEIFDIVFLDGLHTAFQTYADFKNVLSHVHEKSLIIIDDTVPCDEFSAIPNQQESYIQRSKANKIGDGSWHGDVFKVILALSKLEDSPLEFATIKDFNNPKTVIWLKPKTLWPRGLSPYEEFSAEYSDYFDKDFIHASFKPVSESDFYSLLLPGVNRENHVL